MEQKIWNPHDKLFKQLLGEPENAASFLASNLPADVVARLDLKSLRVVQVSFIDAQFVQSEADLLFSVEVCGRQGYVYFLFEHQSTPDGHMMLRLLSYMVRVWKRFEQENPGFDLLPPIIPMVLFHGPDGWQGPTRFESLVDTPAESFLPFIPHFECRLFDLSPFGQDRLMGNAIVRILGDLLGAHGRPDPEARVARAFDTLNELLNAPSFARYLEIFFRYVLQVFKIPKEDLGCLVTRIIQQDVEDFLMTTYEQLLQEGRVEGRVEGINYVLSRQLSKKFRSSTDHLDPLLQKLDPEQQDELSEKILEASSLEEIHEWLELVCRKHDREGENKPPLPS